MDEFRQKGTSPSFFRKRFCGKPKSDMNDRYSIYIHIPFCKARCGYCAFSSCTDFSLAERYFAKLNEEMDFFADKTRPIYTLYIGGGTPSSVEEGLIDGLFAKLRSCFDLSRVEEVTVECNPESATDSLLACLKRNGTNRLSFGLQSVNDSTLRKIGRLHTYRDFLSALSRARAHGFDNINADLIIGLPETHADFLRSVQTVVELPLTHVSVYALELHEGTPLFAKLNGKQPFDEDEQADMYDEAVELLSENGFARYEISNFAKQGQSSKHNLHYWQEGRYFAFGASASGFVNDVRFTNPRSIGEYLSTPVCRLREAEHEEIDLREEANEFAMLGLRLEKGVSLSEFSERFGTDFWQFFSTACGLKNRGFLGKSTRRKNFFYFFEKCFSLRLTGNLL